MNESIIASLSFLFVLTLLYITFLFSQKISKSNLYYGIFIEEENKTEALTDIYRSFKRWSTIVYVLSLLLTGLCLFIFKWNSPLAVLIPTFLSIFAYFIVYLQAHKKTKAYKATSIPTTKQAMKMTIDPIFIQEREHLKTIFTFLSLIPLLMAVASFVYLVMNYNNLPNQLPIHWNFAGKVDGWAEKSIANAFMPTIMQVMITILFTFICRWILQTRSRLNPTNIEESRKLALNYLKSAAATFLFLSFLTNSLFASIAYGMVTGNELSPTFMIIIVSLLFISAGIQIFVYYKYGQRAFMKKSETMGYSPEDRDEYWLWGTFYNNPNDPSIMVEKRYGVGWTINIGNTGGKIIGIVTILFLIGVIVFAIASA
ncbi:MAG: DUF1648 domain-containing protein [Bacillaceae bacterium]